MRQGKFKFLLAALLFASGLLFAGGEARADENALTLSVGGAACDVTFTGFSPYQSGSARYAYTYNTATTISNIDLEIPANIVLSTSTVRVYFSAATGLPGLDPQSGWTPASFELFGPGVGDSGTKLGTGDKRYSVLKINSSSKGFPLKFHILIDLSGQSLPNGLGYKPQVMLLKSGNGSVWDSGTINIPSEMDTPPLPEASPIGISRQTIEKKDASGNITGNITFYFENGLPACSCVTVTGDQILDFPCNADTMPTNCSKAFLDPLLVCIPFFGKTAGTEPGEVNCSLGSENCMVVQIPPPSCTLPIGTCTARCDTLEYLTLDTTIEVGPHSCTCTTSKVRLLNGTYKTITSCSGTPCP